jgi:hypothetical protein
MALELVIPSVEQRLIIKFLAKEKVIPAEIFLRLIAQYGEKTMSSEIVYSWYSKFSEGRKEVSNLSLAYIQPTAVSDMNIH